MTANRVVIRGSYCHWKTKTNRKANKQGIPASGFTSPWLIVAAFVIFAGIYLYFINNSATKGYQIRQIEKEISQLKKENEQLRIKEAELKSLYHIEEKSKYLNMSEMIQVSYIEEKSPVAIK